jgi:signal transduction histidine kinase/ActR/RegA family two-component response regulator
MAEPLTRLAVAEAERLHDFVALLLRLAGQFINLPLVRVDDAIGQALADTAGFVGADRAYLFAYDFDARVGRNTHEWCAAGIEPQREALLAVPFEDVPDWLQAHLRGEAVHVPDKDAVPPSPLRDMLEAQGVWTTIALPLMGEQGCTGFVGFDFVRAVRRLGDEEVDLLKLFAQMLVNVGERGRAEAALSGLNASLEARVAERTRELARAKERAEAADRAKSALMARVSHELRTPLNAVLGFAQLLELDEALRGSTQAASSVAHIRQAGAHLLRMVDEVLDLAHAESGRLQLQPEVLDLGVLAAQALALTEPLAQQRGIALHGPPAAPGPWVRADRTRLHQVLMNLLSNAIKYNRAGGSVWLDIEAGAQRVGLAVRDTGAGLTAAQRAGLFEPFNRLGAESTDTQGTGLGLAITRQLVLLMDGALQIDSEPGRGSCFTVQLPAVTRPAAQQLASAPSAVRRPSVAAETGRGPLSVLYVEDNPTNLVLMQAMIDLPEFAGVTLHTATDGPAGLAAARQLRPGLILLDLSLPGMDGRELLQQLRVDAALKAVPCIAVSAYALAPEIESALQAGFQDYVTKPFSLQRLVEVIDRCRPRSCPDPA